MEESKTKAADTITERGRFVRIGLLFLYVRPLTISQVVEIGELAGYMEKYDIEKEGTNVARFAFSEPMDAETLQDVALIAIFRSRAMRKMFGWYVKRRMSTKTLKTCFSFIYDTFDYAFFFTASLFLRGIAETTKKGKTETARGESWVES